MMVVWCAIQGEGGDTDCITAVRPAHLRQIWNALIDKTLCGEPGEK